MNIVLKHIGDQVLVITGATSGIGLATARAAARAGAKVVLAGRSENALRQIEQELHAAGSQVECVVADVGREGEVRKVAEVARWRFGGFDTWVNNAGVSIYGRSLDVPVEDQRRLFETNFWGVVQGSRVALEHLRERGGALINVGSVVSDRAFPLQGAYSASKAAVKAYTDTLRMELEQEGAPVSVTLVQPASIDTPFPQHARNYMDQEPNLPAPVYTPQLVADAILHAAENPVRDLTVGGSAKLISTMEKLSPRLTDHYMERSLFNQQKKESFAQEREDSLYQPSEDLRERGAYEGHVFERSWYSAAARMPVSTAAIAVGAGLAVVALFTSHRRTS
ncbi:MAG: SDR family oxidoreductase [Bryobacteraceae bacterium]|nr:SDR family oxidoreductase [Bryobacteraceae bacterium]